MRNNVQHQATVSLQDVEREGIPSELQHVREELGAETQIAAAQNGLPQSQLEAAQHGLDVRWDGTQDRGSHQPPASTSSAPRPRKMARLSPSHSYVMQAVRLDQFHVEYVGTQLELKTFPQQQVLPLAPEEGLNWQQIYTKHNLAELANAQQKKA